MGEGALLATAKRRRYGGNKEESVCVQVIRLLLHGVEAALVSPRCILGVQRDWYDR